MKYNYYKVETLLELRLLPSSNEQWIRIMQISWLSGGSDNKRHREDKIFLIFESKAKCNRI